jgi:hypothetical protein
VGRVGILRAALSTRRQIRLRNVEHDQQVVAAVAGDAEDSVRQCRHGDDRGYI